ncbi:MAG TPA: BatA domain-containing protein [Humisphaera sp.]
MEFLLGSAVWWGVGAAVVSIPIIIHLLHRQRTQPVLWGAMMFLKMSVLQQKRRKKVEHWILMLTRLALLALLVALLANPKVRNAAANPLGTQSPADVAVVIDYSLSAQRLAKDPVPDLSDADRKAIEADVAAGRRDGTVTGENEQKRRDELARRRYGTVYRQSIAQVANLLKGDALPSGSTVSVVLAGRTPELVTPEVPLSKDQAAAYLDKLRDRPPGVSSCSFPAAIQKAQEAIRRGPNGRKSVIVLHDGQAAGWDVKNQPLWEASVGLRVKGADAPIKLYEVTIPPDTKTANLAVEDLRVTAGTQTDRPVAAISVNQEVVIKATVRNTGVEKYAGEASARLFVDGAEVGSPTTVKDVEPGKPASLTFSQTFGSPGSHWFEVRLDAPDALAVDNVAAGSVFAWQRLPVLVIGGRDARDENGKSARVTAEDDAFELLAAMRSDQTDDARALVQPTVVDYLDPRLTAAAAAATGGRGSDAAPRPDAIRFEDYALIVLNTPGGLDPLVQAALADYVRSGHGLWIILGPSGDLSQTDAQRTRLISWLNPNGLFPADVDGAVAGGKEVVDGKAKPTPIKSVLPDHEILEPLNRKDTDAVARLTTVRWWRVQPRDAATVLVSAQNATNDPLVLERSLDQGKIVLWATPPVRRGGWNNWSSQLPTFTPLVAGTVQYLARGWYDPQKNGQYTPGEPIVWRSPSLRLPRPGDPAGTAPQMVLPDGKPRPAVATATLIDPVGGKHPKPLTGTLRRSVEFARLDLPGKYELRFPDEAGIAPVYYAVGPDIVETKDAPLTDADRAWLTSEDHRFVEKSIPPSELAAATGAQGDTGMELWPVLAGVLLAFLLFETFMTFRMIRRQSTTPGTVAGAIPAGGPTAAAA